MAGLRSPLSTLRLRPRERLRMTRGQDGSLFLSCIELSSTTLCQSPGAPCCRHYPGAATGGHCFAHPSSRVSLPRKGRRVGLRIDLFEACSAFTHVAACTLALSPYFVTRLPEGFSHFVTSIAAPVASGWSGCRVGLAPTGKRRLFTAHTHLGHTASLIAGRQADIDTFGASLDAIGRSVAFKHSSV